ncbi:hypothetical protein L1987_03052 [Smallanthus sonchifolius]|uniref:Uncharacterized protein n=1 Tax=Smallanthus sonchifolius TaxID=185202 RepID=A0ACB9K9Q6_9ASTR|nr:hypothetical protein L1987_03052 [Smallanthus sonchifolius]
MNCIQLFDSKHNPPLASVEDLIISYGARATRILATGEGNDTGGIGDGGGGVAMVLAEEAAATVVSQGWGSSVGGTHVAASLNEGTLEA